MAPASTALTTQVESGSPYQLNRDQIKKASSALLNYMSQNPIKQVKNGKPDLLAVTGEDEPTEDLSATIWLNLTTKKHITDTKRLKPSRISVPHLLHTSSTTSICLITADPQRTYKDIVSSPAFPSSLSSRITRVIGISKIKKKYVQYEAQRQLFAEHDIFLADDRIVTLLPRLLGKTFYKSTAKRPIPVSIQGPSPKSEGKRIARAKEEKNAAGRPASPKAISGEIEKAIGAALVHLSPSTNTSVRVGYEAWTPEDLAENVEVVANALVDRFVPQKWRGVKALYIKGPNTAALPIWLADELWADEGDVLDDQEIKKRDLEAAEKQKQRKKEKRKAKAIEEEQMEEEGQKTKKTKLLESNDANLDIEIAARKERLKKQKQEAEQDSEEIKLPMANKKGRTGDVIA